MQLIPRFRSTQPTTHDGAKRRLHRGAVRAVKQGIAARDAGLTDVAAYYIAAATTITGEYLALGRERLP